MGFESGGSLGFDVFYGHPQVANHSKSKWGWGWGWVKMLKPFKTDGLIPGRTLLWFHKGALISAIPALEVVDMGSRCEDEYHL